MISNIEIGRRLEDRRLELRLTMDEVANMVGIAKSTVQRYEKGKIGKIKLPVIESFASALNVNPNWLIGKSNEKNVAPHYSNVLPLPNFVKKPRLGTIACGNPTLAIQETSEYDSVPDYIHCDFTLTCKGDSMINARIFDGDIVYIRRQETVENGEIAAVLIDDEATLKRVRIFEDHLSLEPENPQYRPLVFWGEEMNNVHIIGKAVAFTSNVR